MEMSDQLHNGKRTPCTDLIADWASPRVGVDNMEEKEIS
jgi:hypothetical protein